MKRSFFSSRYEAALSHYLDEGSPAHLQTVQGWGAQALATGWQILDFAKLHEQTLITQILPRFPLRQHAALIRKAGMFFSAAIKLPEKTPPARNGSLPVHKVVEMLSQRTVELAATNCALRVEVAERKSVELALKKSEHHYSRLLEESDRLQQQLRQLSRQILSAQEEERKEISRELHDVIAQALTGINVRLAALAKEAGKKSQGLDQNILKTQQLVERSVDIVHRFARELRPAVLDDLGLIPALHSFLKNFTLRTGIRTQLTAFASLEKMDTAHKTSLFRVAQEALTNASRHSKASRVEVTISKIKEFARMEVRDNGISFDVQRKFNAKVNRRLGLLGMKERAEMFGGAFAINSAPGHGTTVRIDIPLARDPKNKLRRSHKTFSEARA